MEKDYKNSGVIVQVKKFWLIENSLYILSEIFGLIYLFLFKVEVNFESFNVFLNKIKVVIYKETLKYTFQNVYIFWI